MENIVLFGSGGHAKVILDILEKGGKYKVLGTIDDGKEVGENVWCSYDVIGKMEDIGSIPHLDGILVSIGDNWIRSKVVERILEKYPDISFINAVHPSAQIAGDVEMGVGNVVMANAIINSGTKVGNHCVINTRASVDHDNRLEDFVTVAPGSTTGGDVRIGEQSYIALGASIIHGKNIGEHTIVGAGSVVVKDIPGYVVAYGIPAKTVRKREAGRVL